MTPEARKQKAAHDRGRAAVHEAGHVAVALHVGVTAGAYIYPIPVIWNDDPDQKTWNGATIVSPFDNPTQQQLDMAGVAGAVAEISWKGGSLDDWQDLMSLSDWGICQRQPEQAQELRETVDAVAALLNRETGCLWLKLWEEAQRLIEEAKHRAPG